LVIGRLNSPLPIKNLKFLLKFAIIFIVNEKEIKIAEWWKSTTIGSFPIGEGALPSSATST
jgi:hypothetical protein